MQHEVLERKCKIENGGNINCYPRDNYNCHSELVSESIKKQTLNQVQGDICDVSSNDKILGSLCKVQGDRGKCNSLAPCGRGKKAAFTLAEVLITLGVIGVVAAMTIPTLMANIRGQQYRSQFKKTLSTLNQAVRMNKAQYGWEFSDINVNMCNEAQDDNPETTHSICAIINGNLKGHTALNYTICSEDSDSCDYIIPMPSDGFASSNTPYSDLFSRPGIGIQFALADGSIVVFIGPELANNCYKPSSWEESKGAIYYGCVGFIDVNGISGPNKEVECSQGSIENIGTSSYKDCVVSTKSMGDIFPIVFYDSVVEPLTNASKYVLNTAK